MSIFKYFSCYFYFRTPPHIILLLLSSCLLTISIAIPVPLSVSSSSSTSSLSSSPSLSSSSSVSSPFNRNSNSHLHVVSPYRYNSNYYGKNDDLASVVASDGFSDDNFVGSAAQGKSVLYLCEKNIIV